MSLFVKRGLSVPHQLFGLVMVVVMISPHLAVPPYDMIMDYNMEQLEVNGTSPGLNMNYTDFSHNVTFAGGDEKSGSDKTYSQENNLLIDSLNDNLDQNSNEKIPIETDGSDRFNYDFLHAAPLYYDDLVRSRGNESNDTHDALLGNYTNDEISIGHVNNTLNDYFKSLNRYFLKKRELTLKDFSSNISLNGLLTKINLQDSWIRAPDFFHQFGETEFFKQDGTLIILFNVEIRGFAFGYDKIHVHSFLVERGLRIQCFGAMVRAKVHAKLVKKESIDTCHLEVMEVHIWHFSNIECECPDLFETSDEALAEKCYSEIWPKLLFDTISYIIGTSLNMYAPEFPVCHNIADTINLKH